MFSTMPKPLQQQQQQQRTEPLSITASNVDPRQIQIAKTDLENLCRKPAKTAEEK